MDATKPHVLPFATSEGCYFSFLNSTEIQVLRDQFDKVFKHLRLKKAGYIFQHC